MCDERRNYCHQAALIASLDSAQIATAQSALSARLATAEQTTALLGSWNLPSTCVPVLTEAAPPSLDTSTSPSTLSGEAQTLQETLAARTGVGPGQVQLTVTEAAAGEVQLKATIADLQAKLKGGSSGSNEEQETAP